MRAALQKALRDAAGTVGKGDEYAKGLTEYARASKMGQLASELTPSPSTAIKYLGGGYLLNRLAQAFERR